MLSMHNDIIDKLYYNEHKGRKLFKYLFGDKNDIASRPENCYISVFNVEYLYMLSIDNNPTKKDMENIIKGIYRQLNFVSSFDHYFKHLYRILKFVDGKFENKKEGYEYTSILRAMLSDLWVSLVIL